jgi:hypothetical protein
MQHNIECHSFDTPRTTVKFPKTEIDLKGTCIHIKVKVKLSLHFFIEDHAMEAYGVVEV